ncbi:hypothetical protein [Marinobacter sp. LV10R510-11A]|uniref:hypothetical protein n=1 Tax=Marinobacter sp. LV10R510-11A TaxID=1415568 RepID=UPI000BB78C7E|nr:hypothetical protein [Marinobacter sp. LV10R510-11A]
MRQTPLSGVFGVENAGHSWEALQQAVDQLNSLVEDRDMLAENLENLVKKERLEGMLAGRQEGRLEGRKEGRQEGEHMKAEQIARNLISRTEMNDQVIAEIAGLTVDEVSRLRPEIKH